MAGLAETLRRLRARRPLWLMLLPCVILLAAALSANESAHVVSRRIDSQPGGLCIVLS